MKTIKIDFCNFWDGFDKQNNLFTNILSKHFQVKISSDPDFVICSNRGDPFEYTKYNCVRIIFMGENISPDYTVFDYAIGFDHMQFGDRYFRLPLVFYRQDAKPWIPEVLTEERAWNILKQKKYFCNFIYGHASSHGMREELFKQLSTYKQVVSPGSYLNNLVPGGKASRCSWHEKARFVSESKFTIAGDSISYPGFVTEKIMDPFVQHSIPVYFGNPVIDRDFNTDSFVWCRDKEDIERVLSEVRYLDEHDDAYIDMLLKSPLADAHSVEKIYCELETFLCNIFMQDKANAYRRVRCFAAEQHEQWMLQYYKIQKTVPHIAMRVVNKLYKIRYTNG